MSKLRCLIQFTILLSSAAQLSHAQSVFGSNLIVNAGAESGAGGTGLTRITAVPGWQASGGCDVYAYAVAYQNVNGVAPTDIVPRGAGNNYFAGGMATANCAFTQTPNINLTAGAATIDAGNATFAVSGFFGGYGSDHDNGTLTVAFLNSAGTALTSVTIGGVGPDDRANQQSGMYFNKQLGQVPVGARSVTVTLNMNWVDGSTNEAAADNLVLILNAPAATQSLLGVNLIVNPGADASPGLNDNSTTATSADLPGWVRSAYVTADSYQGDTGGDLYQATGVPPDAASNYFYGGETVVDSSNPIGTAYQDIDVSSAASLIDAGTLPYALSGWLGGYSSQDDNFVLTVQFESWKGTVLGTATLGPVLAADRNDVSELLFKSTSGNVPAGTRLVNVSLTITREEGTNNDGLADSLSLVLGSNPASGPEISQTIISAGAYGAFDSVTPGTWMEIYGANLARDMRQWGGADFNGVNAPTSLDGTSVTVAGQPAVVYFISSGQVNALVPEDAATGPQPVVVATANGISAPFTVSVNPVEPGLLAPASFIVNGNQYLAALFSDGQTYVLPANAIPGVPSRGAQPGETILVYGVGFGATTPAVPNGQITEVSNNLALPIQILFGSTPAKLNYWGLAPTFVGLYQFNVVVPNVPSNDLTPISFTLGGAAGAQTLYTSVE
jgi:uncharacterized protein (TIGR03437 family)